MDNTFAEVIFQIKLFFYNLIEAFKFSNENKPNFYIKICSVFRDRWGKFFESFLKF